MPPEEPQDVLTEFAVVLREPIAPKSKSERFAAFLEGHDEVAFGAITLGDVIYDRICIDPAALAAFDFAHAPNMGDIHSLATWSEHIVREPAEAFAGSIDRLQGYVFERMAAISLHESGAVVEFPDGPTNPGWDFLVNGEPVQAKCGLSPSIVYEHFKHYPSIPRVVVPEDLGTHFEGNQDVISLHGITHDDVIRTTEHSLNAAADMLDLHLSSIVPIISLARNAAQLLRGDTTWRTCAENVAVDAGGRLLGAGTGKLVGGILAVGVGGWAGILLPIATTLGGYRGGRFIADEFKRRLFLRSEYANLLSAIASWCSRATVLLDKMRQAAARREERIMACCRSKHQDYDELIVDWRRRLAADSGAREYSYKRFVRAKDDPLSLADGSDILASAIESVWAAARAGLLAEDLNRERVALLDAVAAYVNGLKSRFLRW